jgi:N-methylhydantoinase B
MTAAAPRLDGAELAILDNRLQGIARKMANTLLRSARSGVINRARDFSCCIVTAGCELIAAAESLPIHVLSGPDLMARAMMTFHPQLGPGDAFLHNSPYHGCSHAADHTLIVPVFDKQGTHRFTVLAKAHQADIGNSVPTTYYGAARDVYEEGALIFAAVQVERNWQPIDDVLRMCRLRIRVPDQWWGDYLAMLGAARIGERELTDLGEEIGWDTLDAFSLQWLNYSERLTEAAIRALPAGDASASSTHDPFPGTPEAGIPITAKVRVDPHAGRIVVDLTDNPDCLPCGLNLSEACARTAAMIGVFNSIDHTVPKNAGSFRRIEVRLRENCIAGIPRHPTSCSVATTNVADRVANAVQCAIAELAEGFGMAEVGAVIAPAAGVVSGVDPRTGKRFVNQVFLGFSGGAGAPRADAWMSVSHVGNGGLCFQDSIELAELYQPIHIGVRRLVQDSEGAGAQVGAPAMLVEFSPVGTEIEIGYVSDGVVNTPQGVRGGLAGTGADQRIRRADGQEETLPACAQILVRPGETVISRACGGGGYGPPLARAPAQIRHDVAERWITPERARLVYGLDVEARAEVAAAEEHPCKC